MATVKRAAQRHPDNAPGEWFVDTSCINCGAAYSIKPGVFVEGPGQCVVAKQPVTRDELMTAWRARVCCPTASIHTEHPAKQPPGLFPEHITDTIYRLGYNARVSWGAHSFAVLRASGNVMVDSPRWTPHVLTQLEAWDGLAHVLLTHRDDVADAGRYAAHFGARVWIHEADRDAAPFATDIFRGDEAATLFDGVVAIPLPGHTKGSAAFLFEQRHLFTGDSLSWDFEEDDLAAWEEIAWYSWDEQRRSLRRLLDHSFEWVLSGHGASYGLPAGEMRRRLAALLDRLGA
jgi:glyoxylase-like metal-dependent hydrolase (beta-lactamase superfamily II)